MAKPTLTYWNGRGLCEPIRFMLAVCQVDYDEVVPGFDGATHIEEKRHFESLRDSGMLMFNQVPLLCIDGLELVQSRAIVRYLANRHGLAGGTPAEVAICDITAESIQDWMGAMGRAFEFCGAYDPDEERMHAIRNANTKYLPLLERLASKSNTGFLMGGHGPKGLTYPDVLLLEGFEMATCREPTLLDPYPTLKGLHAKLRGLPEIKAFLESDKRKSKDPAGIQEYRDTVRRCFS